MSEKGMIICPKCEVAFHIEEGKCPFCGNLVNEKFNYKKVEEDVYNTGEESASIKFNILDNKAEKTYFNKKEYLKCIHLFEIMGILVIIGFVINFGFIGYIFETMIHYYSSNRALKGMLGFIVGGCIGGFFGWVITVFLEKMILEAYWRIDMLNILKRVENKKESEAQNIKE